MCQIPQVGLKSWGIWRADKWGKEGKVEESHPLAILWANTKMFLEGGDGSPDDRRYDLLLLDYFASKVDQFLLDHLIHSDDSLHAILYEWRSRMRVDAEKDEDPLT